MHYLPIEVDVKERRVAVLGGEALLIPKIERLLAAQALVLLYTCGRPVAGELARAIAACGDGGTVVVVAREPHERELETACAIFASPGLAPSVLSRWGQWARREARLFCAIDRPEHNTFASPAAAEVSGIGVRCFSAGVSPGLVKRLCHEIAAALGDERFASFVQRLAELRASLPPASAGDGRRAAAMRDALHGFRVVVAWTWPSWFLGSSEVQSGGEKKL